MIAAKEALMLGGVAIVAYLAFKPTEGEGFGGAGGEGVEKKEPSEAGDIIYEFPPQVDYSDVIREILGGQPTFEEVFPERDPYTAPIDEPVEKKLVDSPVETFMDKVIAFVPKLEPSFEGLSSYEESHMELINLGKRILTTDYLKTHNIFGKEIAPEEEREILEKKTVGLTLGKVLKPEPYSYEAKDPGVRGFLSTLSKYTPQTPGYLATGDYVRYSEAGRPIYGPTHEKSSYAKTQGFIPKVKSSFGRKERVAAWKKVHGEPTYSGTTHHQKASN